MLHGLHSGGDCFRPVTGKKPLCCPGGHGSRPGRGAQGLRPLSSSLISRLARWSPVQREGDHSERGAVSSQGHGSERGTVMLSQGANKDGQGDRRETPGMETMQPAHSSHGALRVAPRGRNPLRVARRLHSQDGTSVEPSFPSSSPFLLRPHPQCPSPPPENEPLPQPADR